ncbi:GNAT family N-acetyltransferase [Variovorax guangxiensis]|uniref:GNAT family N-acetyltransferase n=1 Tax=Variovorax guangxiensis TaxID=1775474 RepID=UPI002864A954|nr:GNAT family N-acetyltransferase [Variovorax guangxiensis]MDR6857808.1 enamine deaminase RidA (YjgF/YER057c/UK114 family)/GNAT superfamily N-acetyltransferase [Variovorax guangxiensis]
MIRPALPADARAIAEVHVQSWQCAYRDLLPHAFLDALSVEKRQAMWAESLAKGAPSLLVAEVDDRIVGFSAFGICRDSGAASCNHELWAIYLAPSHWSTGAGRQLWLTSRAAMAARGAARISLWVLAGNERAIRFYSAAGFQPETASTRTFAMGGAQVQEIRYVLQDAGGPAPASAARAAAGRESQPLDFAGKPVTRRLISSGSTFEQEIGYSRAVVDGEWVFVSGTTGFDYATMTIRDGVVEQAEQCLLNIGAALAEAGASFADVVRVTYVLPRADDFPACWPVLRKYFGESRPAAMMISAGLADPRMKIEIEVTARKRT